ncbi:GGDEF domain-containing protein [Paenibacillus alkaliterrae]|uniref:GGDEF domain-containing protein n=1 Tax=Paenibacillus alkaliterrae TaxID=320909 RepID=UPI001F18CC73|nr:GGDEF domain-containing protein [Paenibacillus alkaliterrae]MCF2940588.1 GGDEF domain-containing protein [Paenibacillus alkaliterrae]
MTNIFIGNQGDVYYASLNILVLTLMLLLAVQLLIHRKKRAYLTLGLCMAIMLVEQFVFLGAGLLGSGESPGFDFIRNLFNAASFILANMGVYQLYAETSKKLTRSVYWLLGLAVLLSLIPIVGSIYQLLLGGLAFYVVYPLLNPSRKYLFGLSFYTVATIAHLINSVLVEPVVFLHAIDNLFRVGFYAVLFVILFDRVIELMENIYRKSTRDALTGLYNRFYFYTTVSFMVSEKTPISIIFFDLDNFKKLNDTRGHEEGDKALKSVASILKEEGEEIGIAGRYGGEEMVMMIEDPDVDVAEVAEKVRYRIESETIVTASIGYASYEEGLTTDQIIKNSDNAMYNAKKTGKNKVVSYENIREGQHEAS